MVFSSKVFLFAFLPISLAFYYLMPKRIRNYYLLAISIGFYAFGEPKFVFVMMLSILMNYGAALVIDTQNNAMKRAYLLYLFMGLNLSLLFVFK